MRRTLTLLFMLSGTAYADAQDPDDLIARGHYARGAVSYEAGHYAEALAEFEAAHQAKALPAFDYNIASCLDRLGRKGDALAAFERYLKVASDAANAAAVRERVALLRHELQEAKPEVVVPQIAVTAAPTPEAPRARRYIVPGTVGGGALVFAAIGAGLLGSASVGYHDLSSSCSTGCPPSSWSSLPAREHAGEALLGIAGAVAIVDVVLWVRAARRK